jgi:hypothetical protein
MKRFLPLLALLFCTAGITAEVKKTAVIASTSWTAAFADLAGINNVPAIAPASLRHPPEYEITAGDIQKITDSDIFVYAGFERMMKTLGDSTGSVQMIKIQCDNSVATVESQTAVIAAVTHTEAQRAPRVAAYKKAVNDGAEAVKKAGINKKRVLCNKMQIYLAKDLGLEVTGTFGPGPVTASQIADAKNGNYDIIIDNVHNPVAQPLVETAPHVKLVVWRNFPAVIEHDALLHVVQNNISILLK